MKQSHSELLRYYGFCMISAIFLLSCSMPMIGPFNVDKPHGGSAPYGEGRHPGIDLGISTGTPIIAASNGRVLLLKRTTADGDDGDEVVIMHGKHFISNYAHLSKVFVMKDQLVKRGQLIALSGASNSWGKPDYQHLHFGICKIGRGGCLNYSNTYDPNLFWLGGQPQCFDPKTDYSAHSQKEITIPVACGDYAKTLTAESKKMNAVSVP